MPSLPMNLYTNSKVRELEQLAYDDGLSPDDLMLRAGQAAAAYILRYWLRAKNVIVITGPGNNGGDGFVVARLLKQKNINVTVVALKPIEELKGAAANAAIACQKAKVAIQPFSLDLLKQADLIVDAILGTGLKDDVKESVAEIINQINSMRAPTFSLDIPSGICADTGKVLGTAITAVATITFIGNKIGLSTGNAPSYCGTTICNKLGLPQELFNKVTPCAQQLNLPNLLSYLPHRMIDSHKGTYGHVLVIGGNDGFAGAPVISALAALRSGVGRVTVATRPEHIMASINQAPEIMCKGIQSAADLEPLLERADVIVIGPGLGDDEWAKSLFEQTIKSEKLKVIDASALSLLSKGKYKLQNAILTPHPGEAAALLNSTTKEVQADRLASVEKLFDKYQSITVLKGAGSLVKNNDFVGFCTQGNPGMAVAGMGDLLAGLIASLLAQQMDPMLATCLATTVHSAAGDMAIQYYGMRGLAATDLLTYIRMLLNPELSASQLRRSPSSRANQPTPRGRT